MPYKRTHESKEEISRLREIFNDELSSREWLIQNELMPSSIICQMCGRELHLIKEGNFYWRFRCKNCSKSIGWKVGTIFYNQAYTVSTILTIILFWWLEIPASTCSLLYNLSYNDVLEIYRKARR